MEISYILHPPALPPYQMLIEESVLDNNDVTVIEH